MGGDMIDYYGGPVTKFWSGGLLACLEGFFCAPCIFARGLNNAGYGEEGACSLHFLCSYCKFGCVYASCLCDKYFAQGMNEVNIKWVCFFFFVL